MKLSDFLRWGSRRPVAAPSASEGRAQGERRHAARLPAGGSGWIYWADGDGASRRVRARFLDVSADGSGLGFVVSGEFPEQAACWALPDEGQPIPLRVRHEQPTDGGVRVGAALDFAERRLDGAGSAVARWVDEQGALVSACVALCGSGQGLIELAVSADIPAGTTICLVGSNHGCLSICRGSRFEAGRYIVVAEAISDSFALEEAA